MTVQVTEELLADVAREILEAMAFVFANPDEVEPSADESVIRASICFEGPFDGELVLTSTASAVPALAANMMGEDDPSACSSKQVLDAFGELANVICGNLLSRMAGPDPVFNLKSPRIADEPAADVPPEGTVTGKVHLDEGVVTVTLRIDGEGWVSRS